MKLSVSWWGTLTVLKNALAVAVGAGHADLFFHAPDQQEKTLSAVWTFWYRLFIKYFSHQRPGIGRSLP